MITGRRPLARLRAIVLLALVMIGDGILVVPASGSSGKTGGTGKDRPFGTGGPTTASPYNRPYVYAALSRGNPVCRGTCAPGGSTYTRGRPHSGG
uniref:Uncharacterized protein n=1 Tax=Oryza brachyantha TaxID=4533 RepID=J3MFB7_ORYBR